MNPEEKKVGLSIRAVGEEASRPEVEAYKPAGVEHEFDDRGVDLLEACQQRK